MIENEEDLQKALKYRKVLNEAKSQVLDCRSNTHAEFRRVDNEIREYEKKQTREENIMEELKSTLPIITKEELMKAISNGVEKLLSKDRCIYDSIEKGAKEALIDFKNQILK